MVFTRRNPPSGYYVYFYLREDGTPYYVGKGKGVRAWVNHRAKSKDKSYFTGVQTPLENRIIIVHHSLTEVGSCALERRWIRWYGRKDIGTGILRNRTDGGEGGGNPSPETIEKGASKRRGRKRGPRSEQDKQKIKDGFKGKTWWNNGEIARFTETRPGPNWVEGKGIKTWNNGIEERCQIQQPGPEWVQGTLKVCWTNGVEQKYQIECPGPEWQRGRSEETKKKNGDARRGVEMEIVTCPVCGKSGGVNAMKRNHFDNCGKAKAPSKGKKAYNKDGITKFFADDPGDGWVLGSHYRGELKVNFKEHKHSR